MFRQVATADLLQQVQYFEKRCTNWPCQDDATVRTLIPALPTPMLQGKLFNQCHQVESNLDAAKWYLQQKNLDYIANFYAKDPYFNSEDNPSAF